MKDKIPFYDIVNKFFVGTVFSILFVIVTFSELPYNEFYKNYAGVLKDWTPLVSIVLLIAMYEIGFIINRLAAITIGPALEKTRIWKKDGYKIDISEIKKQNETFNAMITELVLSKSHILVYLVLCIVSLICQKWVYALIFALIIVVFIVSGKRHNQRINVIREEYALKKEDKKEQRENETGN